MSSAEVRIQPATNLPHLQSVQRAMEIPTVNAAVNQAGAVYTKVKGANSLLNWALSTAERTVIMAASGASPYVATPLAVADSRLAAALTELERRVPLVAEPPSVILETAKNAVTSRVSPHVNKVCAVRHSAQRSASSLKDLSWAKANELLSTPYGQKALNNIDSTAAYALQLLDYYLPAEADSKETTAPVVAPQNTEPALHAVQTVGRLSQAAATRVWANAAKQIRTLQASGIDPKRYIAALLAVLHLTALTQPAQGSSPSSNETSSSDNDSSLNNARLTHSGAASSLNAQQKPTTSSAS